jgi:chromosome partitioning protein
MFSARIGACLADNESVYEVVLISCPSQLGFLTLSTLSAAIADFFTGRPQRLHVMSASQFLHIVTKQAYTNPLTAGWTQCPASCNVSSDIGVLDYTMLKSTAISDAGLSKQTLHEDGCSQFSSSVNDCGLELLMRVNSEVDDLHWQTWGRE